MPGWKVKANVASGFNSMLALGMGLNSVVDTVSVFAFLPAIIVVLMGMSSFSLLIVIKPMVKFCCSLFEPAVDTPHDLEVISPTHSSPFVIL
ncbi:MAG: hypothetical protein PHY59_08540, partial [Methanobacterium sp.]|nr:hypothetical protein [Methanobacterium sp.]